MLNRRSVANADIAPGGTSRLAFSRGGSLLAFELYVAPIVGVANGAVGVVDATLGAIRLIKKIRFITTGAAGNQTLVSVSGEELDAWSRINVPGSERFVESSTADDGVWRFVLRWDCIQSMRNLEGAIPLGENDLAQAEIEIDWDTVDKIATGSTPTVSGKVYLIEESRYDVRPDFSYLHGLRSVPHRIRQVGENKIELPDGGATLTERLIVIGRNGNPVRGNWGLFETLSLDTDAGITPRSEPIQLLRASQLRNYGGDDVPMTGVVTYDLRRSSDVLVLGGPQAPQPELRIQVPAGASLTNAVFDVLLEELVPQQIMAA